MSKPKEPHWLTEAQVRLLHTEVLHFGGSSGLRDQGMLQSALARPVHRYEYGEEVDLFDLAAAYGFGLAKNHPFIDGNKRVALIAMRAFLFQNGRHFAPGRIETVTFMEGLASEVFAEDEIATWLRASSQPRE
ncbi:MAG: type II toxin-antitoxin system death-on-curing family toxin [Bacteroidetes bacterium]|nr:type II toxin-antitoxin system death-on-curing family toxin [Bacteroidota bacterium]